MTDTRTDAPASTTERDRRVPGDVRSVGPAALTAWAASHALLLVAAAIAASRHRGASILDVLTSWDGHWYVHIARAGYPRTAPQTGPHAAQSSLAFFPGYPILVRGVHTVLPVGFPMAAILATAAVALVATLLFGMLVAQHWGAAAGRRATFVFAFFPGSVVLSMAYAEGLLLAAALGCYVLLHRRRWVLAGLAGALASFTRATAVEVVAGATWVAGMAVRDRREWRAIAAPVLSLLGFVAFFGYLWQRVGRADAFVTAQRSGWGITNDLGQHYLHTIVDALDGNATMLDDRLLAALAVLLVVLLVWLVRCKPPSYLLVTALVGSAVVISNLVGAVPRFVLGVFPLMIPPSVRLRGWALAAWVVVSGVAMALLLPHLFTDFVSSKPSLLTP